MGQLDRLHNSRHEKIRELTKEEGISINQFISSAAAEKMATLMTERYLLQRAQKADVNRFRAVLDKVPDVEPEEQDRIDILGHVGPGNAFYEAVKFLQ